MEIIEIKPALVVLDRATSAIKDVLRRSSHKDPLLAIYWHGEAGEAIRNTGIMGPSVWLWSVWTHDSAILKMPLNPYLLRWEDQGFLFHTQTHDVQWAKAQLDQIYIDEILGRAVCCWKGGPHEAITHIEIPGEA